MSNAHEIGDLQDKKDTTFIGSHLVDEQPDIDKLAGRHHDAALDVLGTGRVIMTHEQSEIVRKKIDRRIMPFLVWMYFLQTIDKGVIGYAANFGMITQTHLVGNQYSLVASSGYWAQLILCVGPAMVLIVKIPTNILMSVCAFCWGVSLIGLAFSKSFGPLLACRFLLGLFEAINIPLFTIITATWYRRSEQPFRIGIWSGQNGTATIFGSLLAYALSFVSHSSLYLYQILFLMLGLITVLSAPIVYFFLDNNPATARFLTQEERAWAVERLRSNNTGTESKALRWKQAKELFTSPLIALYFLLIFCINIGSTSSGTFGPLIVKGFGFNARKAMLLNLPFGAVQFTVCIAGCLAAAKWKRKSVVLLIGLTPPIIGAGLLYGLGRAKKDTGPLLFGYYCLACLFGINPVIFAWVVSNVAGHTKKSLAMSLTNAGLAVGCIIGPLLFNVKDTPTYKPGLVACLGIFIAGMVVNGILTFSLYLMNKSHEKRRVALGKPAKMVNTSLDSKYEQDENIGADGQQLGHQAFVDLTDVQNDEFVYSY